MIQDPKVSREDGPPATVVFGAGALLALGAAIWAGLTYGPPGVVLVLVGGALALVIAAFWTSVRMLIGEARLSGADAYAIGTQHTEEEQKRAVLRALKDLEFERSVGKISEDDYRQLVARYRWEAKRLLQVIDEKSKAQRQRAEAVVEAHLAAAGLHNPAASAASAESPSFTRLDEGASPPPEDPNEEPASKVPASEEPASEEPASEKPASEDPASEDPASEKPASEEPASEKPSEAPANVDAPSEAASDSTEDRRE
jgi:hypothetical protein